MRLLTGKKPWVLVLGCALALMVSLGYNFWRTPTGTLSSGPIVTTQATPAPDNTDSQIRTLQDHLKQVSDDSQGYASLGLAYLQKARETADPSWYAKGEASLNKSLSLDPQNKLGLLGQGSLSLSRHNFAQALDWGLKIKAIYPNSPDFYPIVGDAQLELGRYDEAFTTFQTMVDRRPDLSTYSRVSYARELNGDTEGSIQAMQKAFGAGLAGTENAEWCRVQVGNLYFNHGRLKEAQDQYEQSLAQLPNYPYALAGLAQVKAALGFYPEAESIYNDAIARMPQSAFIIGLGNTYQAEGKLKEAQDQYALVKAQEQLLKAGGIDDDMEMALFEAEYGGHPQQALQMATTGYPKRPTIKADDTLAWSLYMVGGHDQEALDASKKALRLGTQDANYYFHAGMIASRLGNKDLAGQYLHKALDINPYFSPIFAPQAHAELAKLPGGQPDTMPTGVTK